MADIIDNAQDASDAFHRSAMTTRQPEGPKPDGFCHACGHELTPLVGPQGEKIERRFCDATCRDDYEYTQRRISDKA
jgi:hypothetical protein